MKEHTITIINENGEEIVCDILFTYESKEFNKNYVFFAPKGSNEVSAACYKENGDGQGELFAVETEEEWNMLEELLEDFSNRIDENEHSCGGNCSHCSSCSDDDCDCDCDGGCDCDCHE